MIRRHRTLSILLLGLLVTCKTSLAQEDVCRAVNPSPENIQPFSQCVAKLVNQEEQWENHPRFMSKMDQWLIFFENNRRTFISKSILSSSSQKKAQSQKKVEVYEKMIDQTDGLFFYFLNITLNKQGNWKGNTKWILLGGSPQKWNERVNEWLKALEYWRENDQKTLNSFKYQISKDNKARGLTEEDKKRHEEYKSYLESEIKRYEGLKDKYKSLVVG